MNEHLSKTDEAKQTKIDTQGFYSVKTKILKNNIYGVDLDHKAVEITKLNLLLKAAEKYRKLPEEVDLHIKQGNSLIDDEKVVGLNAFKWTGDFQEGSFDIIIGNPPYIRIQTLNKNEVDYFNKTYESPEKNYDIYILFIEKGFKLLKENGILGFILPHKFFRRKWEEY
jgi:type I restriction-modification system DNA methylase subunit